MKQLKYTGQGEGSMPTGRGIKNKKNKYKIQIDTQSFKVNDLYMVIAPISQNYNIRNWRTGRKKRGS